MATLTGGKVLGGSGMTLREMSLVKQCWTRERLGKMARDRLPTIANPLLNVRSYHLGVLGIN